MLTLDGFERLADSASLARGRDYFRRGLVLRATTHADGSVDGAVEGESVYQVTLLARRWSCTCPVGAMGSFCKHCVAVALAARAQAAHTENAAGNHERATTVPVATDRTPSSNSDPRREAQRQILSKFRTRRALFNWDEVSAYVDEAYTGIEEMRRLSSLWGASALISVCQRAFASVVTVIQRADDSNGEIGDLANELLVLHAELCAAAPPPTKKLVAWLIDIQFDGSQDFFEPDIVDYANALGSPGLERFREQLNAIEAALPAPSTEWDSARRLVAHNRERLAVAAGDPIAVIASFGELTRSYRMHDLAKALAEIGAIDQAIAFAEQGALLESNFQAQSAGRYWCELLHEHRSQDDELAARQLVFDRWPISAHALALARVAGAAWADRAEDTFRTLENQHHSELIDTLLALGLADRAWQTAMRIGFDGTPWPPTWTRLWTQLVASRVKSDPASVVPVLRRLIAADLTVADARNYSTAIKRLKQLRNALRASARGDDFAPIVAALREEYRRRPRLLEDLDRAGL